MHHRLVSAALWIIPCFLFVLAAGSNPNHLTNEISINCGSTGASVASDGRRWLGDIHTNLTIKGSSAKSTVTGEQIISAGPVPYKTARISRSQFSYIFQVNSGQKLIRLHFNPSSYNGFKRSKDLFTVEAGPFTLLSNFSASIAADVLAVNLLTKEFCIILEENYPLNVTFSPASANGQAHDTHAFINGIEVISVPETLPYCHTGGSGVQVVGEKFLVYIDNSTALEMVHRQTVKRKSVSPADDFGMWAAGFSKNGNSVNNITWRVSVDVGFRYLARLHFCELGLRIADHGNMSFVVVINQMVACSEADIVGKMEDKHGLSYRNYIVMVKGRKLEGKRDIIISLQLKDKITYGHSPLEGFEIFKLSNHDNSLASPNPLPPTRDSWSRIFQTPLSVLGGRNTFPTVFISLICLLNIIVHILRQTWEANFPEEEQKPTARITRTCRCFSLPEIQAATKNFSDAFIIGKGGFGKVYKGFINDGPEIVAIKRLKPNSNQGKREFWTEVETLSELRHVNLVSLIGYCNEQNEMILVYDYMPNGTLADQLYKLARKNHRCSTLSWEERLEICIGAGRGLDYLHTGKGVIHRDVKASNILLDETFVAKVSDFGLAKTECVSGLQSQDSINLKGTYGYIDPDYFKTRKLTTKSDTYAFGVVLLEVLCGRPAVDPLAGEDERSITTWALDKIRMGDIDRILAPSLSGGISPDSLKTFLGIVERCLYDEPNKRPTISYVIINLEFALEQQNRLSLLRNDIASVADFMPFTDKIQQENSRLLVRNEITDVSVQLENATSLLSSEITGVADVFPRSNRTSMSTMQLSHLQNMTSPTIEQTNRRMISGEPSNGRKDGMKTIKRRLKRLLPWDAVWRKDRASRKTDFVGISVSAPISNNTADKTALSSRSTYQKNKSSTEDGSSDLIPNPSFRIFSFLELKVATRNFKGDMCVGEGGFGRVYKGFLEDKSTNNNGSRSMIAIKRLSPEGMQGFKEWLSEINFLGKLSHPNLVKLLGYCMEDKELLLVYEFAQKGNLGNHLFHKGSVVQTLPWNIRIKILTGAARGLSYLHTLEVPVIYRDFKTPNILLDGSYNAKLSDFGLAKSGPSDDYTHVSTSIVGTCGYAAPEYIATGHLTLKSDVYGFGVVLLETLTGLRAIDQRCLSGRKCFVDEIKPCFNNNKKLNDFMDSHLEGRYPAKSALQVLYHLAKNCLDADMKARPPMKEVVEILEAVENWRA